MNHHWRATLSDGRTFFFPGHWEPEDVARQVRDLRGNAELVTLEREEITEGATHGN